MHRPRSGFPSHAPGVSLALLASFFLLGAPEGRAADADPSAPPLVGGKSSPADSEAGFGRAGERRSAGAARSSNSSERGALSPGTAAAPAVAFRPSEFQRFVQTSVGRLLPVFGASVLAEVAERSRAVEEVPPSHDYTVGPGDQVIVRAWGSIDVDFRTSVDRNGLLSLPKVGTFKVGGIRASELEQHLRSQIGRLYTNFGLSVELGKLPRLEVFVLGPAQRPGVYTLPGQSTILSALVAAGGPSPTGSMRKITLRRDGRAISELDVYEFLVQGGQPQDVKLIAGDVVVIQPVGARIALSGATDSAGIYELKSAQEPLSEILRYAGGTPVVANLNKVHLERIDPTQAKAARSVEEFGLDAVGLQTTLRDGDVLTLLPVSPQFANAVTLRGPVAQPLRYAFQPGMRIRDLIPDLQALIPPDFYRRKNLLVQMIDEDDVPRGDRSDRDRKQRDDSRAKKNGPDYVFDGTLANGSPAANLDGLPTSIAPPGRRSLTPERVLFDRDVGSARGEEVRAMGAQQRKLPTPLFEQLNLDHAVVERLDRVDLTTRWLTFNLGKAVLEGDEPNNIELMAGDVVTIYGQKDFRVPVSRQTRLVSLEGEIMSPGVYQLLPSETLKGLLQRAGGLTAQAFVYGMEFSREEARMRQRENLAAARARLQELTALQGARDSANRRGDAIGAASSGEVSRVTTEAQLSRISRIEPNGRIALELPPEATSLDALPDLPLENGDRILVPPRPDSVVIVGAVANNSALVWTRGRTVGEYLALAGREDSADLATMFVLRADGTVTTSRSRDGWFAYGGLQSEVLHPGDAVIVPNQLDYETFGRGLVRNLKDFSKIFSGFGVSLASIKLLKTTGTGATAVKAQSSAPGSAR